MQRTIARYLLLLTTLTMMVCHADTATAQSKKQLQQEKARIEAEIKKLDKQLKSAKADTRLSQKELKALNKKINERNKLIKNINYQMSRLDQQIIATEDSVALMRTHVDSLKQEYAKVIRALYRQRDNLDITAFYFDNPNYNKSYLRYKYHKEYSRYRQHQAAFIRQREQALTDLSNELQVQRSEKKNLLTQEKRQKEKLDKEKKQQQCNLTKSQKKEKQLNSQISKKQQERKALDKQIQRIIAEEVAEANKKKNTGRTMSNTSTSSGNTASKPATGENYDEAMSNAFTADKGRLSWPVYYKRVLREFGRYQHESGGENMSNGIELETAAGASVMAVFNGTVTRVFTCPNGTKGIIVRHGEFMSVYANLGTVAVKDGTQVTAKQKLGTVYAPAGSATGDFSFQIWEGRTPVNPRQWLRQA